MSEEKASLVDGERQPAYAPPPYEATPTPQDPVKTQPVAGQAQVIHVHQHHVMPMHDPPPDFLIPSILACIFCCWPLGLVAIVKALDVRNAVVVGDRPRAENASRMAKNFTVAAVVCGIIIILLSIIINVVAD
ncbi:proline-rich transmembrane protein 1-like [Ptychodera flava]|uniref:proline-rich transmembrane protein 1-like n=1 Tax=Ptychodera flava TaxID=63121 RepID=UPI00396A2423